MVWREGYDGFRSGAGFFATVKNVKELWAGPEEYPPSRRQQKQRKEHRPINAPESTAELTN